MASYIIPILGPEGFVEVEIEVDVVVVSTAVVAKVVSGVKIVLVTIAVVSSVGIVVVLIVVTVDVAANVGDDVAAAVVVTPPSPVKHWVWMVSSLTIPLGPRTSQPPHPVRGHCTYASCSLTILPLYGHRVLAVTCQLTQTRAGYGVSVRPAVFS